MTFKRILSFICVVLMVFALVGCSDGNFTSSTSSEDEIPTQAPVLSAQPGGDPNISWKGDEPMVIISVEGFGDMKVQLAPEYAPITVENFLSLVNDKFYDGLTFHRVVKGFMIQGGSTDGIGIEGSKNKITGEFMANGVQNPISHVRGVISMARTSDPNSASSQFFICDADATFLDGQYAAFGQVVEGFDVLDAIASVKVGPSMGGEMSKPAEKIVISSIRVAE